MNSKDKELLRQYADRFETPDFINGDPSWFMHQVKEERNQETMAFIASCLSYGSRKQFLPKIQTILEASEGETYLWIKEGEFNKTFSPKDECFYRLYSYRTMTSFFNAMQQMISKYGSLKDFARNASRENLMGKDSLSVLSAISEFFQQRGITGIVPRPVTSLCKRPCMFIRWMARINSPVDIGIWNDIIDRKNLYIPMDTHVMQTAQRLGLITTKSANWNTVVRLTEEMKNIFPDDPARGDFALYGADL